MKTLLLLSLLHSCTSILPTAEITIVQTSISPSSTYRSVAQSNNDKILTTLLASEASFGPFVPMKHHDDEKNMSFPPYLSTNLFCDESDLPSNIQSNIIAVPRGKCSFQKKASLVQQVGGSGMIVYNTLDSRYDVNASGVIYPVNKQDYDCSYGSVNIPVQDIILPYNSTNDNILSRYSTQLPECTSKKVLLTGKVVQNGQYYESCCAWDLHVWLYNDPNITETIKIPSLFITMGQYDTLKNVLASSSDASVQGVTLQLNERYRADYNPSALLTWALGVCVAAIAAYLSASEYYGFKVVEVEQTHTRSSSAEEMLTSEVDTDHPYTSPPPQQRPQQQRPQSIHNEETLELTMIHAIVFILFASTSLFILFFFQIYNVVKIMYGFGCSGALTQVIFYPLFSNLNNKFRLSLENTCCTIQACDLGVITYLDLLSGVCGYALGITWLIVGFTTRHPDTNAFYWIMQDIMGCCICITFLGVIKVNSLKVATTLLGVAFFYDIFFVFITPLIFSGESVMITVATSGGPPSADPTWCEKYPDDKDCQGGDPLPMLFTIPRFGDYLGGSSMLGLGDIVLPGLLISLCRRVDVAKCIIGLRFDDDRRHSTNCEQTYSKSCTAGYYIPCVIAYAIGLIMANMAVYIFQMGQPALLYLVPMCCGTVSLLAHLRGEFNDMWNGPKVIRAADAMVHGQYYERNIDTAVPIEQDGVVLNSVAMDREIS